MAPPRKAVPAKTCLACGSPYVRATDETPGKFARRKYCGLECARKPRKTSTRELIRTLAVIDPVTGCWEWQGSKANGYARMWDSGKGARASRVVWRLFKGEFDAALHVLHRCDNPGCVNPDHLFLGTHQDNMDDRDAKGRLKHSRGSRHPNAKLTEEQVRAIRSDPRVGRLVAADYGVAEVTIQAVRSGRNWGHL